MSMTQDIDDLIARLGAGVWTWKECQAAAAALRAQRDEIARWRELHRVIAEELGTDMETWPDHRNAPLAIAATFMLHKQGAEKAEAERDALRKDAERLDWAERVGANMEVVDAEGRRKWGVHTQGRAGDGIGPTLRAAIDAAIQREKP